MNLAQFFAHWSILENPFTGEEARDDAVFAKLAHMHQTAESKDKPATALDHAAHSDFEKILGSLSRPATSVVFGEKGSGKTALRMQIADHIAQYNRMIATKHPGEPKAIWVINYDDLNSTLDSLCDHFDPDNPTKSLAKMRLVDHIDAILSRSVTHLITDLLNSAQRLTNSGLPAAASQHSLIDNPSPLPSDGLRRLKKAPRNLKRDVLLLQAIYDTADDAAKRTAILKKRIRFPRLATLSFKRVALLTAAWVGWVLPSALLWAGYTQFADKTSLAKASLILAAMTGISWLIVALMVFGLDRLRLRRIAHKLVRQLRTLHRDETSLAKSLTKLDRADLNPIVLPLTDSDETRYAMLDRHRRVLAALGFGGVIVLVDRVDEPTLINGDTERMKSVIWPLFNNKFLQQNNFALKMLLPIELRYALFKESSAFFQEARLDKQNLIERLSWTGSMLYDMCTARLNACRSPDAEPITLLDLFADDVTERDIVEALDQMHQPRDAFKLLYHCLSEHCSNVTAQQNQWQVPRLVLEHVRKLEANRVEQLTRGIRPG